MDLTLRQVDPERHRRRLRLLAELAEAKAMRERVRAWGARSGRIRELESVRRRPAG
jgi:hypothetical protein